MTPIAGIDFGSASCRVAVSRGSEVEPFDHRYSAGRQALPTLVAEKKDGHGSVPIGLVSLKQKAGATERSSSSPSVADAISEVFKQIREDMDLALPDPVEGAVIAVPGFLPDRARNVFRQAALDAGFPGVKLFDEARAAIMGTPNLPQKANVVCYSLGAGMFSTSVVKIVGGESHMMWSEGNRFLGGFTFDEALSALIAERLRGIPNLPAPSGATSKLRKYAEQLKIGLSKHNTEDCEIDMLELFGKQGVATLTVTRNEFENLTTKDLQETVIQTRKAVAASGLTTGAIDAVLVSGGSTRMPLVERLLEREFSAPLFRVDDLAIARGAARYGAQLEASDWKRQQPVKIPVPEQAMVVEPQQMTTRGDGWISLFGPYVQDAESSWKRGAREEAIAAIEEMMRVGNSYLGTLRHELGKSLFDNGRYSEALIVMKKAVEVSPTDKHVLQTYHQTLNRRANQLLAEGHLAEARKMIHEALSLNGRCRGCLQVAEMIDKAWPTSKKLKSRWKR